jgi:photosystem II stability/assembly factor-like uncharacterized protein
MKKILLITLYTLLTQYTLHSQWFQQTLPVSGPINDIAFLNKDTGFVAMDNSNFLRTINGGENWSVTTSFRIEELEIIDNTTLYARAVNQSGFYRTFDGGTTWNYLSGLAYCAFSFINRDTGWISSFSGIYKTTNGGVTANLISTENNCCTKLMMLKEPYNGEYYGWSIRAFSFHILKTTNSGVNWISVPIPSTPNSIFFLNKDTGWVGVSSLTINLTTNAGVNWIVQPIPTVNSAAIEIYFVDFFRGWAGRGGFRIFATTNSGFPWGSQNSPVDGTTSITFIDSLLGWAGSFSIAKTTNGGGPITYVGIDSNNTKIPTSFILKQNYPNPFNPQTTIEFSLPKSSIVNLSIYNLTGQKIFDVIVNEKLSAGNYKYKIDAIGRLGLSSGIYLYRLTAEDFSETRRMVYVK